MACKIALVVVSLSVLAFFLCLDLRDQRTDMVYALMNYASALTVNDHRTLLSVGVP
uniref:Uncharacterized protein n=1 Tax=Aegilops tauschii TaxID=37682 RepID=M8CF85_AEGTA